MREVARLIALLIRVYNNRSFALVLLLHYIREIEVVVLSLGIGRGLQLLHSAGLRNHLVLLNLSETSERPFLCTVTEDEQWVLSSSLHAAIATSLRVATTVVSAFEAQRALPQWLWLLAPDERRHSFLVHANAVA